MICNRCGGNTKEKWIKRKKDGKSFMLHECLGSCKDEKGYPYAFFPPRDTAGQPNGASSVQPNEGLKLLQEILERVKKIENATVKIKVGNSSQQFTRDDMEPDQDVPF